MRILHMYTSISVWKSIEKNIEMTRREIPAPISKQLSCFYDNTLYQSRIPPISSLISWWLPQHDSPFSVKIPIVFLFIFNIHIMIETPFDIFLTYMAHGPWRWHLKYIFYWFIVNKTKHTWSIYIEYCTLITDPFTMITSQNM